MAKRKAKPHEQVSKVPKWDGNRASGSGKVPVTALVKSPTEATISWCLSRIDWDGDWSWHDLNGETRRKVYTMLADLEKYTLADAPQGNTAGCIKDLTSGLKQKTTKKAGPPQTMKTRLGKLEVDDHQGLWELRVDKIARVFFVVYPPAFCHIIWWDPTHSVWPIKRNR